MRRRSSNEATHGRLILIVDRALIESTDPKRVGNRSASSIPTTSRSKLSRASTLNIEEKVAVNESAKDVPTIPNRKGKEKTLMPSIEECQDGICSADTILQDERHPWDILRVYHAGRVKTETEALPAKGQRPPFHETPALGTMLPSTPMICCQLMDPGGSKEDRQRVVGKNVNESAKPLSTE